MLPAATIRRSMRIASAHPGILSALLLSAAVAAWGFSPFAARVVLAEEAPAAALSPHSDTVASGEAAPPQATQRDSTPDSVAIAAVAAVGAVAAAVDKETHPAPLPKPAVASPAKASATSPAKADPSETKPVPSPSKPAARTKPRPKKTVAAVAKPVEPQGPTPVIVPESERVGRELDRTDREIARARRSVDKSKNGRAQKTLASANDFQADARDAYKEQQYARSQRLTLASRDYADRASRMVGPPHEDPEYVENVLKRTDDALDRAKDVLKNGANRQDWNKHEALKDAQKEAWKSFKDQKVEDAYKETLAVRSGVLDLLRQLEDLPVPRETAEKAIIGAKAAMEQAGKDLGPKPGVEAQRFVKLANAYLDKARYSYDHKSYKDALLQAKVVEQHLEKAVDAARARG